MENKLLSTGHKFATIIFIYFYILMLMVSENQCCPENSITKSVVMKYVISYSH